MKSSSVRRPLRGAPARQLTTDFGGQSGGVTPVPIPNTEVKPSSADGTWDDCPWESRTPPDFSQGEVETPPPAPFFTSWSGVPGPDCTGSAPVPVPWPLRSRSEVFLPCRPIVPPPVGPPARPGRVVAAPSPAGRVPGAVRPVDRPAPGGRLARVDRPAPEGRRVAVTAERGPAGPRPTGVRCRPGAHSAPSPRALRPPASSRSRRCGSTRALCSPGASRGDPGPGSLPVRSP